MQTLIDIIKYFWIKFVITIPVGVFILSEQHYIIIYGLMMMIMIDSTLGMWVAIRHKVFSSHKLRKIAQKIVVYFLSLASVWILTCVSPLMFGWAFNFFGIFLIMTELFSNFEKLALLGVDIPTKLLSKLNNNFYDYYFHDGERKKKALKNILNKTND